jgi:hypothetical protein
MDLIPWFYIIYYLTNHLMMVHKTEKRSAETIELIKPVIYYIHFQLFHWDQN